MSKKNKKAAPVVVGFVLDRSGSMSSIWTTAVEQYQQYVADLKADDAGDLYFTLTAFDNDIEVIYDGLDINEVPDDLPKSIRPRGSTSLNDAIAHTCGSVEKRVATIPGARALITVLTDGGENTSREYPGYGNPQLKEMLEAYEATDHWTVVWLSSDLGAPVEAMAMGVAAGNVVAYAATPGSYSSMSSSLSAATSNLRRSNKGSTQTLFEDAGLGTDYTQEANNSSKLWTPGEAKKDKKKA